MNEYKMTKKNRGMSRQILKYLRTLNKCNYIDGKITIY